ncbi:MAG: lipoprotein [Rhodanobacter sp.]|jgi:predicted small lipoprotein YifL|nr:lipoprotein [Rhodanobacter sp.]
MRRSILLLLLGLLAATLTGCGQKGPLVLPTRPAPAGTAAVPGTPAVAGSTIRPDSGPR